MKKLLLALSSALLFGQAQAGDMTRPAYKAAPAAISGNLYVWVDGTYNQVRLPSSSLGFHSSVFVGGLGFLDTGPIQTFDNKLDGAGVRGAFGYVLPGSTLRFELGGSYVSADGSSQQTYASPVFAIGPVLLAGGTAGLVVACSGVVFSCVTAGSHASDYDAWEINGKAAWDVTLGSATFSPSLAVFGGNSRNREMLSQALTQRNAGGVVLNTMNYQAETRLRWTDYGARAGLDARFPVFAGWTIDVSGWAGLAQRDVKLDGSDVFGSSAGLTTGASTISVSDDRTVFLANAEAGLSYKFNPSFTIRGFAGLNYDSKVPGIAAPSYAGSAVTPRSTAAGIIYSSETNYYTGGGVSLKF